MATKKTKERFAVLDETDAKILGARWHLWTVAADRLKKARWFNRRRREQTCQEAYRVLNEMLVLAYGHGAVLDTSTGAVRVRLP